MTAMKDDVFSEIDEENNQKMGLVNERKEKRTFYPLIIGATVILSTLLWIFLLYKLYWDCLRKGEFTLHNFHPTNQDGHDYMTKKEWDDLNHLILDKVIQPKVDRAKNIEPEALFDAGAGSGGIFWAVAKRWPHIRNFGGIDWDIKRTPNCWAVMNKYFPDASIDHLRNADMLITPWRGVPDQSYDYVVSLAAAGIFISNEDMHQLVEEMLRIAKPGARFGISSLCGENCKMIGWIQHFRDPEWWTDTFFPQNKYFNNQVVPESIEILRNVQKDRYAIVWEKRGVENDVEMIE